MPLSFGSRVSYGSAFGDTTALPPQRNFFVGGSGAVRGFEESHLGPRDSLGNPYGGDFRDHRAARSHPAHAREIPETARASVCSTDFGQVAYLGDTKFTDKGGYPARVRLRMEPFPLLGGHRRGVARAARPVPLQLRSALTYRRSTELNYGDELTGFQFSIGNAF